MHQTLTIGRFTVTGTPDTLAAVYALQNAKPRKPRAKAEKRAYPRFVPGMSTAEYVRAFFSLNTGPGQKISAYMNGGDHTSFYQTLNTAPAALPTGEETVETIEKSMTC
jgi:hypothetical protein